MSLVYSVNSSSIASEVIDGEAIIMNLGTGYYHSTSGLGAVLWQAILDGASQEMITCSLSETYPGVDTDSDFDLFLSQLKDAGLVAETSGAGAGAKLNLEGIAYTPPSLDSYGDMQDLIMLDPIHDVSDQHGWPVRPAEFGGSGR